MGIIESVCENEVWMACCVFFDRDEAGTNAAQLLQRYFSSRGNVV